MSLDMGCKLVLFSYFLTSALVDSFPYPEGNIFGAFQSGVPSEPVYFQPNPIWPQNQVIPQSTPNPVFAWNSNNNKQLTDGNNFGRSPNAFGNPQIINSFSIDNMKPVAPLQNGYEYQYRRPNVIQPLESTPLVPNNGFSEVSWNNQRFNRPQQTYFGQPYNANSFIEGNTGIYGQEYSNYQSAGSVTPNSVGFAQTWFPQKQYNIISTPRPVEAWPKSDNDKIQPMEAKYLLWPEPDNEKGQALEPMYLPLATPENGKGQPLEPMYLPLPTPDNEKGQPLEPMYLPLPTPDNEKVQPLESMYLPLPMPDNEKGQPLQSMYLPLSTPDNEKGQPIESMYLPLPTPDNEKVQPLESMYLPLPMPDNEKGQSLQSMYLPLSTPDNEKVQPIESKYLLWPKPDSGISQPIESKYLPWPKPDNEKNQPIESNSSNNNNTPSLEIKPVDHLGIPPGPSQPNSQQPILRSQQPVKNQKIIPKRYIIVDLNETNEHVNLDNIEMEKSNIVRIISKEPPNNISNTIIEIEKASEFDKQMSLQVPYDTEITKIPRGTEPRYLNSNGFEHLGKLQSHEHPDFTKMTTEDTTYLDMKYFKPEYIIPIQSTTENNKESTTNSSSQIITTNTYVYTYENSSKVPSTTGNLYLKINSTTTSSSSMDFNSFNDETIESTTPYYTDSTINRFTQSAAGSNIVKPTKSTTEVSIYNIDVSTNRTIDNSTRSIIGNNTNNITNMHFENSEYSYYDTYEENRYNKMQKQLFTKNTSDILRRAQILDKYHGYKNTDSQNINTNIISQENSIFTSKDDKKNNLDGHDTIPLQAHSSDLLSWNLIKKGNGPNLPTNYQGPEETSDKSDKEIAQTEEFVSTSNTTLTINETCAEYENYTETSTEKDQSTVTEELDKLREDLKIDVSELKTTVKGPVVWFNANKTLWDNIAKGEKAFDAVSIYDVKCKPKLIERITKIHHYQNGTEIVDYAEIIWDSPDAVNPKEIKSKREIRESKTSD